MAVVYYEKVHRKYVAPRFSLAWFVKVLFVVALVVLPYLIGWWTHSFWKKRGEYTEQPQVSFTHKLLLSLETQEAGSPIVYSTVPEAVAVVDPARVRQPVIESIEVDHNLDGVTDYFNLTVTMPLEDGEEVHRASLALFFDLELRHRVRMKMETLVHAVEQSPLPGADLTMLGHLYLRLLAPLHVNRDRFDYEAPILDPASIRTVADVLFPTVLTNSFLRNDTTEFVRPHSYWTTGVRESFRIHAHIKIPRQPVEYVPEFWEVLKFSWVQYLAILAVLYYFADLARWFIHKYQLVDTRLIGPRDTVSKPHQL